MSTIDNSKVQTPATQASISPKMALELLKEGNNRFLQNQQLTRNYEEQIKGTSQGQYPFAVILSCIDSRVATELIFDQGIGDLFNACVAGNFVNKDILGSLEFACKFAGVKLVMVMGHTSCGAVKGACDSVEAGNLTQMLDKIMPAVNSTKTHPSEERNSGNIEFVNKVASKNVEIAIENIKAQSTILNELFEQGQIDIVGSMYDVSSGKVDFL